MAAATTLNFTEAARKAATTQSGISQHIARLEEQIGTPLFNRIGKSVQLTDAGRALMSYIERHADQADQFLEDVRSEAAQIEGVVSYAMPPSCLMSPHLPNLLDTRQACPGIDLRITIASNPEVHEVVHRGQNHFGFVTEKLPDPALSFLPFCCEEFVMAAASEDLLDGLDAKTLAARPFISYPGFETLFNVWRRAAFPQLRGLGARDLNVSVAINALEGALVALRAGAGLTVVARHCLDRFGPIPVYKRRGLAPLMNLIHIVKLADVVQPRRVRTVIDWFLAMKA